MRNLFVDFDGTLLAMAEIEGENWLSAQLRRQDSLSVRGAVHYLSTIDDKEYRYCVYGDGGWFRWYVDGYGRVFFSSHHSHPAAQSQAQALGFDLT